MKQALVIGSGFGGLAAAIRLQSAGIKTTIVEKKDLPGGRAYVFRDQGFQFDAGPTVITAPECLEELFRLSGRSMSDYISMQPLHPFYRLFWDDGYTFDYDNDEAKTLEQIGKKSPQDVEGFKRFLDYSKAVYREGYQKLGHVPFLSLWSMLRVAPQLLKVGAHRSVYKVVSKYIQDEHLRQAFSFHPLLVGGNPFQVSAIYALIHFLERDGGVWFPKGGTGALVQALVKLFEDLGGTLRTEAEVDEILVDRAITRGVRLKSGETLPADLVVTNAEVMHTYSSLLRASPQLGLRRFVMSKKRYSMSVFVIYFGTKKRFPGILHHNILFGPRYKGLLDDIFHRGHLADDFSLYLHAPTESDSSLAPEGGGSYYVLSPVPNLSKGLIDWEKEAPAYADKILGYLEKRAMPGLRSQIVTQRIITPKYFENDLNSYQGAAFSLEPLLSQSAFFRTHNREPALDGLYFVGAGTHPGAGLPGVVGSAKATVGVILNDLGIRAP